MNGAVTFEVAVTGHLTGLRIKAVVKSPDGNLHGDEYFFYLLKDGQIWVRHGWTNKSTHVFDVVESGVYSIQGHLRRHGDNKFARSGPIFFAHPLDQSRLGDEKVAEGGELSRAEIEVFLPSYPYVPWLLVSGSGSVRFSERLKRAVQPYGLAIEEIVPATGIYLMAPPGEVRSDAQSIWFFSGSYFGKRSLVFGNRNLANLDEVRECEPTGSYSWIFSASNSNEVRVGTDFFGMEKVYIADFPELFLVSTSYHLLLSAMSSLGLNLKLREEAVRASLGFGNIQVFHQVFSHELNVEPVRMLPVDMDLLVRPDGIQFVPTSLGKILREPQNYSDTAYKELMIEAKQEVVRNVESVFSHPDFQHVICDLSGGLDSRAVFAAATNVVDSNAMVVSARNSLLEPSETSVAWALNSRFQIPWDTLERIPSLDKAKSDSRSSLHSHFLGTYFSFNPSSNPVRVPGAVRLTGSLGEVVGRPYYAQKFFGSVLDVSGIDGFVEAYLGRFRHMAISPSEDVLESVSWVFKNGLRDVPGPSALERFDLHYLFFRNGLHFSDRWRNSAAEPEVAPLQSKALFLAKLMSFRVFKGPKVQLDLVNLLQPALSQVPYSNPDHNSALAKLRETNDLLGRVYSPNISGDEIVAAEQSWRSAQSLLKQRTKRDREFRPGDQDDSESSIVFSLVNQMLEDGTLADQKLPGSLAWYFQEPTSKAYSTTFRQNISNRLLSLHHEGVLVETASLFS